MKRARVLAGLLMLGCLACSPEAAPESSDDWMIVRDPQAPLELAKPSPVKGFEFRPEYEFNSDWVSKRLPYWVTLLRPYMGRPDVRYLEVGVWEGRSFLWMIDHVLTHPSSHATGLDIHLRPLLLANLEKSGARDKTTLIEGRSQVKLRDLPLEHYDIIYIDGSHIAEDVLEDCVLAWRLLKPGGLLLLDDYRWAGALGARGVTPATQRPKMAIDTFISVFRNTIELVHKEYQVALRKRERWCSRSRAHCSPLGRYSYRWGTHEFYENGGEDVALSDAERRIVEALIKAKRGDGRSLRIHRSLWEMEAFASLNERLGLGIVPLESP